MSKGFDWLNGMIYGVRRVLDESDELTTSDTIRFTGDGVTATYDSGNKRINIEIPGIAGSISWTTVTGLAASATSPLVIGGSQYIGVTHVRTGATPATTKGQLRATDGVIIAAKIDGTDETVLQTSGSTIQVGDNFGPIRERPEDASNWYVEDVDGVRLLASSTAVGVNRRLFLYGGSAKTATAKGHVGLDSTGRLTVYADGEEKTCLVTGDAGGGAPSRIVALDANDIASWKLDDAAEPWSDGVGSLSLTGYGGLGSYAPAVVTGGSIHGDRSVSCDWNVDSGLRSDTTTVGEVAAGTVHGWALLTQEPGTLFTKDEGSSIYLRTAGSGPATSYELLAKIGDSGEVSVAPTRYRALVHSGGWTHFAMTWSGGTAYVYVNGVRLPTSLSYSSITWGAGRWRFGKCDGLGSISALMSSWRLCNVARSAAYINEVYKRSVGLYP